MDIKTPRGIRDIIYPESGIWRRIVDICERILENYGYRKVFLPVLEYARLFARSIGEETDIVSKEMYIFKDRKGRDLALRPEGTAGCVRAMIENSLLQGSIREKVYYFGPMFRYEKPQEGRYRQFYQIGCEVFGSSSPVADSEIAEIAVKVIQESSIKEYNLRVNSVGCEDCRSRYRKVIKKYLEDKTDRLCSDCRRRIRTNTLRILDCKNDMCKEIYVDLPCIEDYYCGKCSEFFNQYRKLLSSRDIDFEVDWKMVRGLDYYTGPVFELDAGKDTLIAGGRYDALVKELGGPNVPACGWALGMERLVSVCAVESENIPLLYVAFLKGGDLKKCREFAEYFRNRGVSVEEDYEDISPGKKFKIADKKGIMWVAAIGEEESRKNLVTLKNMKTGQQEMLSEKEVKSKLGIE